MKTDKIKNLVKFGLKYVDGYTLYENAGSCFHHTGDGFELWSEKDDPVYRDFLQQIIEGINRKWAKEDEGFAILQHEKGVTVYFAYHIEQSFNFSNYPSITQAKEAAIFYIMEQEGEE